MEIRCFLDEANETTTIVLVGVSTDKVQKIASEILGVAVEKVSNLKSNGFSNEPPVVVPEVKKEESAKVSPATKVGLNTDNLFKDNSETIENNDETANNNVASGEIVTNPIPEDNPVANTSLLKAPVKAAPAMPVDMAAEKTIPETTPSTEAPVETPVQEFEFNFGSFRGKTIKQSLESNPKKAFGYFKWLLADHILANKNPNEEAFKKDVYRQMKAYFEVNSVPQEAELREVAYVLLASCDAVTRDDILSIFGYADIEEFYNANNSTNCSDAIKMALA